MKLNCPNCDAELELPEDIMIGEIISCPECGNDYEVYSVNGKEIKIKEAEPVEEDWGE